MKQQPKKFDWNLFSAIAIPWIVFGLGSMILFLLIYHLFIGGLK